MIDEYCGAVIWKGGKGLVLTVKKQIFNKVIEGREKGYN
jgi:hypothetical protein